MDIFLFFWWGLVLASVFLVLLSIMQHKKIYGLEAAHSLVTTQFEKANGQIEKFNEETATLKQEIQCVKELHEQLEQRYSDESERATQEKALLSNELQRISEEKMSIRERFDLVQHILALKRPINNGLLEFKRLIQEDYVSFAAKESSLANEAGALMELQKIYRELELTMDFPAILGKQILGIAGGFSSGKSAFINSFLPDNSVKLAVGINPVTVIPSYIVYSEQDVQIRGHCANGGSLELGTALYEKLSHEYIKSFGFDLRSVMPYVSVQAPISRNLFEHIALIDTPGYNPGTDDASQSFDRTTATEYVKQCDALIWVVGLGTDGTLPDSDREFIEQAGFSGESLFIVLNKADLKPKSDIDAIMEEVASVLDFSGVNYAGICAYSSERKQFYGYLGEELEQFIQRINKRRNETRHLKNEIDVVFNRYIEAIQQDIDADEARRKKIKRLEMDALGSGGTEEYKKMKPLFAEIEATFPKQDLKATLKECESLKEKFFSCATEVVRSV